MLIITMASKKKRGSTFRRHIELGFLFLTQDKCEATARQLASIIEAVGAMLFHTVTRCNTTILDFKLDAIATQVTELIFVRLVY